MTSSEENRSYSGRRYSPPRRESIADHLVVIRRRGKWLGIVDSDTVPTASFVRDLIQRDIIGGPKPCRKTEGAGQGRRFLPSDYHDLLVVLKLKSRGTVHRSAWICALWLRGRQYPLARVRDALVAELDRLRRSAMAEFAPTGRFTEPFGKKYDKRVRHRPDGQLFPELNDFMEPLAALMMRPDALSEITPNVDRMTNELSNATGLSPDALSSTVSSLVSAMKEQRNLTPAESENLIGVVAKIPIPGLADWAVGFIQSAEIQALEKNLTGLLDDGTGGSNLTAAVKKCSDEMLLKARALFARMRSGHATPVFMKAIAEADPEHEGYLRAILSWLEWHRGVSRQPVFAVQIFATWLLDLADPTVVSGKRRSPVNADDVLAAWRDQAR